MLPPGAQRTQDGADDRAFQAAGERAVELALTGTGAQAIAGGPLFSLPHKGEGENGGGQAISCPGAAKARRGGALVRPQGLATCQTFPRLSPSTSPGFLSSFQK